MAKVTFKRIFVAVAVVLCLLLAALLFSTPKGPDVVPEIQGDMKIDTAFCDLYFPARWESYLDVRELDNTVSFRADLKSRGTYPLFDISFDLEQGHYFGTVLTKDGGEAEVYIMLHPLQETGKLSGDTLEQLYAMQDDVNYLCGKLPLAEEVPVVQQPVPEDLEISTPYGSLIYPGVWTPYLNLITGEDEAYTVEFHAQVPDLPSQLLFAVRMGPTVGGEYLMTRDENGTDITLELIRYPLAAEDSWSQSQLDILYGMMEDAERLVQDLPRVEVPRISQGEQMTLETPYGPLQYPGGLRTETKPERIYTVSFYGTVANRPEQHLYDVCFGGEWMDALGLVADDTGRMVKVTVVCHPLELDGSWTQAQLDAVYAMQESADQVLNLLTLQQNTGLTDSEETEALRIETPYGDLQYPDKWKDNIRITKTEGKPYMLDFYGHAGDIPEQLLFSIAFGGREGIEVTTVADAEGKAVNVYLIPQEIQGPEGDAKDQLYAMAEGAIWVVESLEVPTDE